MRWYNESCYQVQRRLALLWSNREAVRWDCQEETVVNSPQVGPMTKKAASPLSTETMPTTITHADDMAAPAPVPVDTTNIFVVLRDDPVINAELVKVACSMGRKKPDQQVIALYGVEIPRTKRLEDDLSPEDDARAQHVLSEAAMIARRVEFDRFDAEIIQCRDFGHSIIDEVKSRNCKLLIIGMPYRVTPAGVCQLDKTTDFVLEHATCRVWIIRGSSADRPSIAEK